MPAIASCHDGLQVLDNLREHLARSDKPIAFLFGAGTSCAVTIDPSGSGLPEPIIPAVAGLTIRCKEEVDTLGPEFSTAWESIVAQLGATGISANIENILSRLRMMIAAAGPHDTLAGLELSRLEQLEETVRRTIARLVRVEQASIPEVTPHRTFARWISRLNRRSPIEIFTVNYDILIEYALELERIPSFDGFVGSFQPFFHPDSLRRPEISPGSGWTRLWKMHGSVTWRRIVHGTRGRIIRGDQDDAGEMIYPSFMKYDESRQQPYAAYSDRLQRFVNQDDALLVVVGSSFGDEHINNIIFEALENRPRTHVFALQFAEPSNDSELARRASGRKNIVMVGPETGIISGQRAPWSPTVSSHTDPQLFEVRSTPAPPVGGAPSGSTAPRGIMKVGNFSAFCRFLESMTPGAS